VFQSLHEEEKECEIMQEDGIPTIALIMASTAIIIGIVVAFTVITWVFLLA
jgi:hypothetical protein